MKMWAGRQSAVADRPASRATLFTMSPSPDNKKLNHYLYIPEYPDAPAELKGPVTAPIGVGPYTDQWGTFISGFAPVDTGSNVTVILIGVDTRV